MQLLQGNCLDVLKEIPDNSVDSIVTDPPYGLSQQKQEDIIECLKAWIDGVPYCHDKKGFMNKSWDGWVPGPEVWKECLRVLKPGGHMLVFSGTRTQDLMGMAVRLAGFETRDQICWVYGSGFPKSLNLPGGYGTALKPAYEPILVARKPLDGTVENTFKTWGTGVLNIDGCRIETDEEILINKLESWSGFGQKVQPDYKQEVNTKGRWPANFVHDGSDSVLELFPDGAKPKPARYGKRGGSGFGFFDDEKSANTCGVWPADNGGSAARFFFRAEHEKEDLLFCRAKAILSAWKLTKGVQPCSQENASVAESSLCLSRQAAVSVLSDAVIAASRGATVLSDVRGLSTTVTESACERLCETLIMAMLISESVALPAPSQDALIQNGCRVSIAAIQKPTDTMTITISPLTSDGFAEAVTFDITPGSVVHGAKDSNANRLIYCAKVNKKERDAGMGDCETISAGECTGGRKEGSAGLNNPRAGAGRTSGSKNNHPTVKPIALMRYLCRLVTPSKGIVLDPFIGSGSTGIGATLEGFDFIGIELSLEYLEIAKKRISYWREQAEKEKEKASAQLSIFDVLKKG